MKVKSLRFYSFFTVAVALLLFCASVVPVLVIQFKTISASQDLVQDAEPVLAALEHLLHAIHLDNMLVQQYLLLEDKSALVILEDRLAISAQSCEDLTHHAQQQFRSPLTGSVNSQNALDVGILVYGSVERARSRLLQAHKDYLDGFLLRSEVDEIHKRYTELLVESTHQITSSSKQVREQNERAQSDLLVKHRFSFWILVASAIVFGLLLIVACGILVGLSSRPVREITSQLRKFRDGKYETRISIDSSIEEFSLLQDSTNAVLSVVEEHASEPGAKLVVDEKLLLPQYVEILEFVDEQAALGKSVSMKDIKRRFSLTHPTVKSRATYLEKRGLVSVTKESRNKIIRRIVKK